MGEVGEQEVGEEEVGEGEVGEGEKKCERMRMGEGRGGERNSPAVQVDRSSDQIPSMWQF